MVFFVITDIGFLLASLPRDESLYKPDGLLPQPFVLNSFGFVLLRLSGYWHRLRSILC